MKKNFKYYAIAWAILLVLFNVLAFVVAGTTGQFTPSFWVGYVFISIAMVGQLFCAWLAFKDNSAKQTFYNLSLVTTSYAGLIVCFVVGAICMAIPPLPAWIGAIVCMLALAVNVVTVVKAKAAADIVSEVDKKVQTATKFIYDMQEESESLLARAKSEEVKAVCKKVREAFKFSDPMSSSELATVETEIAESFQKFKRAVLAQDVAAATAQSEDLLASISERNNKCKRLK
ncbi:MAG: hypothetical protein ACI4QH_01630 [Candidatus Fimimonas sp.]